MQDKGSRLSMTKRFEATMMLLGATETYETVVLFFPRRLIPAVRWVAKVFPCCTTPGFRFE
jgi:hypothetical protein